MLFSCADTETCGVSGSTCHFAVAARLLSDAVDSKLRFAHSHFHLTIPVSAEAGPGGVRTGEVPPSPPRPTPAAGLVPHCPKLDELT